MFYFLTVLFALCGTSQAADFKYDDLTSIIQAQGLTSVDEVLPKLPEEMRSNYTLMRESRSLQDASFENPRAILYGKDGKLTCTFNGDPSQQGYDSLECFQFLDKERKFDFRQIQFPTRQNGLKEVRFSLRNMTVDGQTSCTGCHTDDPRPNFDHYNFWPGAFGETEDKVFHQEADYQKFVAHRASHPRYQWLIQQNDALAPYRGTEGELDITRRPNLRLVEIYGRLNALRAARIVSERLPAWERWAYVTSALHCELSAEDQSKLKKAGFDPSADLKLAKIFGHLQMEYFEWSTQIMAEPPNYADRPWEFRAGFSMFSENVAMALIKENAEAGNPWFQDAIQKILGYYSRSYFGAQEHFNETVNAIVLSTDFFGPGYQENLAAVCPEAVKIYAAERLHR